MRILTILYGFIAALLMSLPAAAQGQFNPAVIVNDRAVTFYEIDQRAKLLTLFRAPGAGPEEARKQLIEDRLNPFDAEDM